MKIRRDVWAKRATLFLSALVLLTTAHSSALSASVKDFYKGKTFTILVPHSPGGGYDTWARLLAPYISKIIGSNVVVVNKSGAEGLVGANYLYTEVKPDGLTICVNQPFGVLMYEALEDRGVKYQAAKFRWLARASRDDYVVVAGKKSPNRSFDIIKKATVVKLGVDGRVGTNGAGATAFCLGASLENAKMIVGYGGSSEVRGAILRGEVDLMHASVSTLSELIKSGDLIPIAIIGYQRSKDLPAVPTIFELSPKMPAENKKWVDIIMKLSQTGRGIVTAPGVPDDKFNFLAEVVKEVLFDPSFVKKVNGLGFTVDYMSPSDFTRELLAVTLTPEEKKQFSYILQKKYPE